MLVPSRSRGSQPKTPPKIKTLPRKATNKTQDEEGAELRDYHSLRGDEEGAGPLDHHSLRGDEEGAGYETTTPSEAMKN